MPEDLYGADRSTVSSTPEARRIAQSFVSAERPNTAVVGRHVGRQPALSAADFIAEYRDACAQTDQLFAAVHPDFLSSRPVPERHRLLFYIGHLEAFDWNLLAARALREPAFHPAFDRLFAFGIDPVGGGLPTDVPEDWPSLDAIYRYRDTVRDRIESAIAHVDFSQPVRRLPEDDWSDVDRAAAGLVDGLAPAGDHDARADDHYSVSIGTLCLVALEHRQMHAETLAYLIHQMPYAHKQAPVEASADSDADSDARYDRAEVSQHASVPVFDRRTSDIDGPVTDAAPMCAIPAGNVTMGLPGSFTIDAAGRGRDAANARGADAASISRFGWDNEWVDPAAAVVTVPAFEIDKWMVTNDAFLRFVEAGGYDDPQWWRAEDWAWRKTAGVSHPAFWERDETAPHGWRWRGMFAAVDLPLDWPVYVSHAEAAAYARFIGKRLPTEAEWLRAAEAVPGLPDVGSQGMDAHATATPFGHATQATASATRGFSGNADFRRWDPEPVNRHPDNRSCHDVIGQFGNGWEWTSDAFAPFEGFKAFPFYRGYSADFFDARHFVMKGGSPRTAARMLRPSFRNWFQAHYPYVYAGFRCARNPRTL